MRQTATTCESFDAALAMISPVRARGPSSTSTISLFSTQNKRQAKDRSRGHKRYLMRASAAHDLGKSAGRFNEQRLAEANEFEYVEGRGVRRA